MAGQREGGVEDDERRGGQGQPARAPVDGAGGATQARQGRRILRGAEAARGASVPLMPRAPRLLAAVLGLAVLWPAAPAGALESTGLYAPFPSAVGGPQGQRYVAGLGAPVSLRVLRNGVSLSSSLPEPARLGAASARAGDGSPGDLSELAWGLGLALLTTAGVLALGRTLWRPSRIDVRGEG
jgi:hypothetical protein